MCKNTSIANLLLIFAKFNNLYILRIYLMDNHYYEPYGPNFSLSFSYYSFLFLITFSPFCKAIA